MSVFWLYLSVGIVVAETTDTNEIGVVDYMLVAFLWPIYLGEHIKRTIKAFLDDIHAIRKAVEK